jgi:hypothetical protein
VDGRGRWVMQEGRKTPPIRIHLRMDELKKEGQSEKCPPPSCIARFIDIASLVEKHVGRGFTPHFVTHHPRPSIGLTRISSISCYTPFISIAFPTE